MKYADEANLTERNTSVYAGIQVFQSFWSTAILRNLLLLLLLLLLLFFAFLSSSLFIIIIFCFFFILKAF